MGYTHGTKWTIESIKRLLENLGYILISKEYKSQQKLIFKDKEGYYYFMNLLNINLGKTPMKFHNANPYTIQNIKLWLKLNSRPFELISEKYENSIANLQWRCLKEGCGEICDMNWSNMSSGSGCGFCHGIQVGLSNCLATKNPELAKEWHPTLNGDLTSYNVVCASNKDVWWICDKNHKHVWSRRIADRNRGDNCPYCRGLYPSEDYNLLVINPELCKEWNNEKNKKLPSEYTPNSAKKVWWQCEHGHEWEVEISSRNNGNGCPYCAGKLATKEKNLLILNPKLCEEWDYKKNDKNPEEYMPNSNKKVWWICKQCNHAWDARISDKNGKNSGCPKCNNSKGKKRIYNYLLENNIFNEPQKEFIGLLGTNNGNLSYDFYLPDYNLLIEYQGEYHDGTVRNQSKEDFEKQQEHDKRKREYANNNNIKLLEIWYWDFENVEEILEKHLNNVSFFII